MAKTRYDRIYTQLRNRIESGIYSYQDPLASEHTLIKKSDCSRSTVRQAIGRLADEGYVQSIHRKGVQMIYQPQEQSKFFLSNIKSVREAMVKNKKSYTTQVVCFAGLTADEEIQVRTTFPLGEQIYYIQRVRYIDEEILIIDHNYLLRCMVKPLIPEIVQKSICEYVEQELGENIVTTKRKMTVEQMSQVDEKYLNMRGYNCMAAVSNITYNAQDIMPEFTQSRHRSNRFVLYDLTYRTK